MDLNDAIQKHNEWKVKFRVAMSRHDTLDAATIGKDNCCDLGKWLHGEARSKWSSLASYRDCMATHAVFHANAGKVAQAINGKKYTEAEAMLAGGTPYATASSDVVKAIMRLKTDAAL